MRFSSPKGIVEQKLFSFSCVCHFFFVPLRQNLTQSNIYGKIQQNKHMKNEINALIMEAMKNHDSVRTESLRAIKSAFLNWSTSKENAGKEMTEADEIQIIKKMVKQRQESVEQYVAAGRQELADAENAQIAVLETFLPKAASEEDIINAFNAAKEANGWEAEKKNMGLFVKAIKAALPNADGKMVAQVVQSQLA